MTPEQKANRLHYHMYESLEGIEEHAERIVELEKLVQDMWFWGYCGHMDSESQEWQMSHIDGVLNRIQKLGIEVP